MGGDEAGKQRGAAGGSIGSVEEGYSQTNEL